MRSEIVRLLAGCGDEYVSGEEISRQLHISRAAVWKHIHAVKEDGCQVEAQTNRGYRLKQVADLLKPEYVNLYTCKHNADIRWMDACGSTNVVAKRAARDGAPAGSIFIAECQTEGKGRLGRRWSSQKGKAIEMSFLLRPQIAPAHAPAFNFAAALGICAGIRSACGIDLHIKWPNDVVYGSQKVCGILTEMAADMDQVEFIVCGAGINVNQQSFEPEVAQRAVSLRMIAGQPIGRVKLAAALIDAANAYFIRYTEGGIAALMPEYCEKSAVLGQEIEIICANETNHGRCVGFGESGEILVETEQGICSYHAGEVSVRGVNRYV